MYHVTGTDGVLYSPGDSIVHSEVSVWWQGPGLTITGDQNNPNDSSKMT